MQAGTDARQLTLTAAIYWSQSHQLSCLVTLSQPAIFPSRQLSFTVIAAGSPSPGPPGAIPDKSADRCLALQIAAVFSAQPGNDHGAHRDGARQLRNRWTRWLIRGRGAVPWRDPAPRRIGGTNAWVSPGSGPGGRSPAARSGPPSVSGMSASTPTS